MRIHAFIVIKVGYEGIDEVRSVHDGAESAVEEVKKFRENERRTAEDDWDRKKADRWCVQEVFPNGRSKCVCGEYGLETETKELILY